MFNLSVANKTVPIFSTYDQVGEHCLYISKIILFATTGLHIPETIFTMALCFTSRRTQTWKYDERNVSDIGVNGKTNHSLRATGADALIQANVPEK